MSNGIKVILLLVVVLFSSFAMTFAQDTPFQVEVVVSVARMRWGPGPTFVVQHYANAGHALTVLEVDSTSNPPWTWYYARTPSNVVAWIRADLVRIATGAAAVVPQVENPTGTYPVAFDNLCNTAIFRSCQDGTDFLLWQAGYWAFDRYEHWERGGWNLDIVYHQNPCKLDRLCSTKEEWDAGRLEAELLAITATPEGTLTPFVVTVVSTRVVEEVWVTLEQAEAVQLLGRPGTAPNELYTPPPEELRTEISTGSIIGKFEFNRESIRVTCQYWHNADQEPDTDYIKSGVFTVNLSKLKDAPVPVNERDTDESHERCFNDTIDESDVVARQWKITVDRSYSGRGRIRSVSWKLTATYGADEPGVVCKDTVCTPTLLSPLRSYIAANRKDVTVPPPEASTAFPPADSSCTARYTTEGESPREITRYQHTCNPPATSAVQHTLKFNFTHDKTRRLLVPTATPENG